MAYPNTGPHMEKKTRTEEKYPEGITLSWQLNAYIKSNDGIIAKIRKRFKNKKEYQYQSYFWHQQKSDKNVKQILNNVSGILRPGQLLAIMGASGAGKTTLLNLLSFRNRKGLTINGDIKINGVTVGWKEITDCSSYVQQTDLFIATLTVREQLVFLAMLENENYEIVDQIIKKLNLENCENTRIGSGDTLKGISGGEKRRLAFAATLIRNSMLMFCDEPTSGLDYYMASKIDEILQDLAKQGKTVACIIHQPSSKIFKKFDMLCLLSEGRVAYFGPTQEAYNFFSRIGYRCPINYNPADYYIQVLAIKDVTREQDIAKSMRICDYYEVSEYKRQVNNAVSYINYYVQPHHVHHKISHYNASYFDQAKWLVWRETLNMIRNPAATYVLIGNTIIMSIFLGLTFLQLELNEIGVQNYKALLFILIMQVTFTYIISVVNSLPRELPIVLRETKDRIYSVVVYYFAKLLSDQPKYIILPFILVTVIFWMTGISSNGTVYITVTLIYVLTAQVTFSFAFLMSIIAPNVVAALALALPICIPLLIFAGHFINNKSIPNYFIWLKYISWFFYCNEAVSIQFWTHVDNIPCKKGSFTNCTALRCFKDGYDVLENDLHMKESNFSRDIILLCVLIFVFRFLSLIALKIRANRFLK